MRLAVSTCVVLVTFGCTVMSHPLYAKSNTSLQMAVQRISTARETDRFDVLDNTIGDLSVGLSDVDQAISLLDDPSEPIRALGAIALRIVAERTPERLSSDERLQTLLDAGARSSNWRVTIEMADTSVVLSRTRSTPGFQRLLDMIEHGDATASRFAAIRLGRHVGLLRPSDLYSLIERRSGEGHVETCQALLGILADMNLEGEEAAHRLVSDIMKSPSEGIRVAALGVAVSTGAESALILSVLRKGLRSNDAATRLLAGRSALRVPHELINELIPTLLDGLRDEVGEVRASCAAVLGSAGAPAVRCQTRLLELHEDPDPAVREAVAYALGAISEAGPEAVVPVLGSMLRTTDRDVKLESLRSLAKFRGDGAPTVGILLEQFDDGEVDMRVATLQVISAMAPAGGTAIERVVEQIGDPHAQVRIWSAYCVGRFGALAGAAVPALCKALSSDPDPDVRRNAARALAAIGIGDERIQALVEALKQDSEADVRAWSAFAIGEAGPPAASESVKALLFAIASDEKAVALEAIDALGRMRFYSANVVGQLEMCLSHEDSDVRDRATRAIMKIGFLSNGVLSKLRALRFDPVAEVREAARLSLETLAQ